MSTMVERSGEDEVKLTLILAAMKTDARALIQGTQG